MATAVGTYVIERFDLGALSEKDVRQIADLYNTLGQERVPEDPVPDPQIVIDRLRSRPNMMEFVEWLARLGTGDIVANKAGFGQNHGPACKVPPACQEQFCGGDVPGGFALVFLTTDPSEHSSR